MTKKDKRKHDALEVKTPSQDQNPDSPPTECQPSRSPTQFLQAPIKQPPRKPNRQPDCQPTRVRPFRRRRGAVHAGCASSRPNLYMCDIRLLWYNPPTHSHAWRGWVRLGHLILTLFSFQALELFSMPPLGISDPVPREISFPSCVDSGHRLPLLLEMVWCGVVVPRSHVSSTHCRAPIQSVVGDGARKDGPLTLLLDQSSVSGRGVCW
ncbi:hypothetical protein QBC39DRAFT_131080 [Podospora conica]|nr:hypothetical protein QBC39DRAFT_131080 [Schizothecium conicum]